MERRTLQRAALLKAFEQAGRPLSPQELLKLATPHCRPSAGSRSSRAKPRGRLGIATVYRNLKALAAEGVLKAVNLPGEATARYELCGKAHHHHFHCRICHHVYEVEGCPGNIEPLVPKGFVMEDHHVILYGLCSTCKPRRRK